MLSTSTLAITAFSTLRLQSQHFVGTWSLARDSHVLVRPVSHLAIRALPLSKSGPAISLIGQIRPRRGRAGDAGANTFATVKRQKGQAVCDKGSRSYPLTPREGVVTYRCTAYGTTDIGPWPPPMHSSQSNTSRQCAHRTSRLSVRGRWAPVKGEVGNRLTGLTDGLRRSEYTPEEQRFLTLDVTRCHRGTCSS